MGFLTRSNCKSFFFFFLKFSKYEVFNKTWMNNVNSNFLLANSTATLFVNPSKACLVDAYPESPLNPFTPTIEPIFTIENYFFFVLKIFKNNFLS